MQPCSIGRRAFVGGIAAAAATSRAYAAQSLAPAVPPEISSKFAADGRVIPFRGNTVICHLPQQGPHASLFDALLDIYRTAPAYPFLRKVTLLPPSSYHMTVFSGANDGDRRAGYWPTSVAVDASIEQCNEFVAARLQGLALDVTLPIRMRVDLAAPIGDAWTLAMPRAPFDDREQERLRRLRDRLAEVLGLRAPMHDAYRFHTTLGYVVHPLSDDERTQFMSAVRAWREAVAKRVPIIELGAPEFCTFEDMFAFRRWFYLA